MSLNYSEGKGFYCSSTRNYRAQRDPFRTGKNAPTCACLGPEALIATSSLAASPQYIEYRGVYRSVEQFLGRAGEPFVSSPSPLPPLNSSLDFSGIIWKVFAHVLQSNALLSPDSNTSPLNLLTRSLSTEKTKYINLHCIAPKAEQPN